MSARQLADAINGVPSQSTIENIELGRKASIDVVQLLNIAMALRVPLVYLLAPIGKLDGALDLPGLSDGFANMTPLEFDAWLSGAVSGTSLEERNALAELQALREWKTRSAEASRLETMLELESAEFPGEASYVRSTNQRLTDARREVERLAAFLKSAGWSL